MWRELASLALLATLAPPPLALAAPSPLFGAGTPAWTPFVSDDGAARRELDDALAAHGARKRELDENPAWAPGGCTVNADPFNEALAQQPDRAHNLLCEYSFPEGTSLRQAPGARHRAPGARRVRQAIGQANRRPRGD